MNLKSACVDTDFSCYSGLKEGFAVSLSGLGVWGILALVQKKKRR